MKRFIRKLTVLILLSLFAPLAASAQNAMSLAPTSTQASVGEWVEIEVGARFTGGVIGGEMAVVYDESVIELVSMDWSRGYVDDPLLRCPSQGAVPGARGCPGTSGLLAMGNVAGLAGGEVGTLRFRTLAQGTTSVSLIQATPFADLAGMVVPVAFDTSDVTVVPEPGLLAGLAIGGLGLAAAGRRRRSGERQVA